jgi:hypothetical protein
VRDVEWEIQWRRRENCGRYIDLKWETEDRYRKICERYRKVWGIFRGIWRRYDGGDPPWLNQR